MDVAWIGLGAMGRPMAANLAAAFPTRVHNRTRAVAEHHARLHGTTAVDLDRAVAADVVFSCLPTSADVVGVVDLAVGDLTAGSVWIDCTSGDPAVSRDIAAGLAEAGVAYLDAPVSGGTDGARDGTLTMMVGGDADALRRVRPVLEPVADRVVHVGGVGAGHAVKAVNNTLLAASLWLAGEGLAALTALGVDPRAALEVINASSGRSFASEVLVAQRVVTREFPVTFALGLLAKDAGIGTAVLDDAAAPAPALRHVAALTRIAALELGGEVDHSAIVRLVERWSGVEIG